MVRQLLSPNLKKCSAVWWDEHTLHTFLPFTAIYNRGERERYYLVGMRHKVNISQSASLLLYLFYYRHRSDTLWSDLVFLIKQIWNMFQSSHFYFRLIFVPKQAILSTDYGLYYFWKHINKFHSYIFFTETSITFVQPIFSKYHVITCISTRIQVAAEITLTF